MQFFLGIDGGGTATRAFAADADGKVGAWGADGTGNVHHVDSKELLTHLTNAIRKACAGIGAEARDAAGVFGGFAGVTTETDRATLRELVAAAGCTQARIEVDHDIRIALAGGLGGAPGIALIVGTGSSCYARTADGRTWQTGGWGALVADEGSGYWLGREAIAAAARMADGRDPESALQAEVFSLLDIREVSELIHRLHQRGLSRTEIAALAPTVVAFAERGDPAAQSILVRGAALLAEMVEASNRQLKTGPEPRLVVVGGLGSADTLYRRMIAEAIRSRVPSISLQSPLLPAAIGAALLAIESAGEPTGTGLIDNLRRFA